MKTWKLKALIVVLLVLFGFFTWLSHLLTPVHPKDPRIGVLTWDGHYQSAHRLNATR